MDPDQLFLDPLAGTLSAVEVRLLLDKPRRLFGCDKDVGCLQKSMSSLEELHVSQLPRERSNLTGGDELKESARVCLTAVKSGRLRKSLESWRAPPRVPSIQTF